MILLLQDDRANTNDACEIWVQELVGMLEPQPKDQPLLFDRAREGQTTNITAFLFAYSSPERQQASLNSMKGILDRQKRIVQQPLASTSDWTRWDSALKVSLWILTFARWGQHYLRGRSMPSQASGDVPSHTERRKAIPAVMHHLSGCNSSRMTSLNASLTLSASRPRRKVSLISVW